ncbi:GNAT family N-acetyltransferase [Streptomyces sp. NPDC052079]|uniref:GNAT family N-acetyltransferase n=1 Tax=Streptomyces sp. NPDC052079 TaxID=3155526 RepID=UPI00342EE95A
MRPVAAADWSRIAALEAEVYGPVSLSEGRDALESRGRASPETCFVLEAGDRIAGYVLSLPYPPSRYPDLTRAEDKPFGSRNLHLHDLVVAEELRGRGLGGRLLRHLTAAAASRSYDRISLVSVGGTASFWAGHGYRPEPGVAPPVGYGEGAVYMYCPLPGRTSGGPPPGSRSDEEY